MVCIMKKMIAGFLATTVMILSSLTVCAQKVTVPEIGFSAEAGSEMVAILVENDESLGRTVITVTNPKGGGLVLGYASLYLPDFMSISIGSASAAEIDALANAFSFSEGLTYNVVWDNESNLAALEFFDKFGLALYRVVKGEERFLVYFVSNTASALNEEDIHVFDTFQQSVVFSQSTTMDAEAENEIKQCSQCQCRVYPRKTAFLF